MSIWRSWSILLSYPAIGYPDVKCRRMERPPFPSGCEISGWGGMPTGYNSSPCARCRDSSPGGLGACKDIQINSIRIPQTERRRNAIWTPSGRSTLHSWTSHPDDSISYSDMLSRWKSLTKASKPCNFILKAWHIPRSAVLQWCVRTPCPDIFAMDSKEFSLISDCFGDQKAIKTPKLNIIWLELIARVFNMLIGLKGDNYYSKVFKRVNHKLSNNTFWVVITNQPS